MKLYLLSVIDYNDVPYDAYDSMLIRASSAEKARVLANQKSADEGEIWEDLNKVVCECLRIGGKEGIIISSFNAG